MTAPFRRVKACPACAAPVPLEDDISQEIRNHPDLKSSNGLAVMDKDLVLHRWKTTHGRAVQLMAFVEIKTNGAQITRQQADTMFMIGQMFRNRVVTPTKNIPIQVPGLVNEVRSSLNRQRVYVKAFGYHSLKLSGPTLATSDSIIWDSIHEINYETAIKLIGLELDPDTLEPINLRIHHLPKAMELQFA